MVPPDAVSPSSSLGSTKGVAPRGAPQIRFGFSTVATQESLDSLRPLVMEHGLENLVMMTGYDDGRWRLRLLW